jgi:hypothetical protein
MLMRNIPVEFVPPTPRDEEYDALLDERKAPPATPPKNADRAGRGTQPTRRNDSTPGRNRRQQNQDQEPVLRPFRSAA